MARTVRALELAFAALLVLTVPLLSIGWLYLLRPHVAMPGPSLPDALPLDELPGHASVPLLPFLAVWVVASLVVGLVVHLARVERLTAGLVAGAAAAGILLAATGLSIFVVRQIPLSEAFRAAGRVGALYAGAMLVGLGGALMGERAQAGRRRAVVVLSLFVAASGLLDVVSAITPAIDSRLRLIEDATPNVVPKIASALVVPAGVALVVLARGLWHRRRRAWELTLALVVAAAVLHLLKGLDYEEAGANLVLALALVARRHDFEGRGDPSVRVHLLTRTVMLVVGIFAYGAAALWINRVAADRPYTLGFALKETAESLAGLNLHGSEHLAGRFGDWFSYSVLLLGIGSALWLLWAWLAPWRYLLTQRAREWERAHELVESVGLDTLAPFALRADKSYFFDERESAFLAYKVVAGVAVVSGDPIGDAAAVPALLERFLAFAHARGWRVAVLGAGERYVGLYHGLGLRTVYHGDEAVVDTARFSLEGRPIRKVRQSVSRLEHRGFRVEVRYAREIGEELRAELEEVARVWRGDAPEKGFTMELDALFRLDGDDAVFTIGFDAGGSVEGFLHFAVVWPGHALSLSSMPRRRETPNGFNEWLVVETIAWARDHGLGRVSMNFAPFAALFAPEAAEGLSRGQRAQRRALESLKGKGFQLDNLLAFNRKFFPQWEHRYVVYERPLDLPRVGLAGLAAEGYLPLAAGRR